MGLGETKCHFVTRELIRRLDFTLSCIGWFEPGCILSEKSFLFDLHLVDVIDFFVLFFQKKSAFKVPNEL